MDTRQQCVIRRPSPLTGPIQASINSATSIGYSTTELADNSKNASFQLYTEFTTEGGVQQEVQMG